MLRVFLIAGYALIVAFACVAPAHCADTAAPLRQPNIHIELSEELLNAVLGSATRTSGPFRESIQGSVYRGRSTTDAEFSVRTEPAEDAVALTFLWQAKIRSNSRSSTDRTDVSSVSTTSINAVKQVSWNDAGWRMQPSRAKARSNSRITGVTSRRVIGRRVARRRAYERQPSVNYSVARRAEQRTRTEFDRQIGDLLASWTSSSPSAPQIITARSTADRVELALLQATPEQLGAVSGLSQPQEKSSCDFALSLHESALNNATADMLADKELREDQLASELKKRFGWTLAGLEPADWAKLWQIDFAEKEPLHVEFSDGTITITLNAKRFKVGDQQVPGARLRAVYKVAVVAGKLSGTRQDRIEISPQADKESENVGARFQVYRSMLRRRFERVFPAEFTLNEFPAPADWPERATLLFASAVADSEWLQLQGTLERPKAAKLVSQQD